MRSRTNGGKRWSLWPFTWAESRTHELGQLLQISEDSLVILDVENSA
jgi:hypothetical protein